MREIKFRAWSTTDGGNMLFVGDDFGTTHPLDCCNYLIQGQPVTLMQYTGLKDRNGVEIYEGDLLNVKFTSGGGKHIHDCIYKAEINVYGARFVFAKLLWKSYGHNQPPISQEFSALSKNIDFKDIGGVLRPEIKDRCGYDTVTGTIWKQEDDSEYFSVIGNIYENPELLEGQ